MLYPARRKISAAARWNPSGRPAAANVAAISSISPIQRQPFASARPCGAGPGFLELRQRDPPLADELTLDAFGVGDGANREQQRRRPLRPGGVRHLERRGVAHGAGDCACVDSRSLEKLRNRARVRAGEVQARRPDSPRCRSDDSAVDETRSQLRGDRAAVAGAIALQSTKIAPVPATERATSLAA